MNKNCYLLSCWAQNPPLFGYMVLESLSQSRDLPYEGQRPDQTQGRQGKPAWMDQAPKEHCWLMRHNLFKVQKEPPYAHFDHWPGQT